jgi:hypothetical protein
MQRFYEVKIYGGCGKDCENKFWGAPHVKHNARDQQKDVLYIVMEQKIQRKDDRKKESKKYYAAENHKGLS